MSLRLNGSTSGYVEIDAPATAGSNTLVLPTGNGSADQVLSTNGSGTLSFVDRGRMTLETAQATTSGTSKDFTGIPSWVKKITVMFSGVSTNGTSNFLIQIGAGSFTTSGYAGQANAMTAVVTAMSTGFNVCNNVIAANTHHGTVALALVGSNVWAESGLIAPQTAANYMTASAGSVTLSGTLDRVRITTVNGTDTFDAGSVNLLLEG
jgi:hypothetical protein